MGRSYEGTATNTRAPRADAQLGRRAVGVATALTLILAWRSARAEAQEASGAIEPPRLREHVEADYPVAAAREGRPGSVLLELTIDADGRVSDAVVVRSAGHGFDEAARDAALRFQFEAARSNGQPVVSRILYAYDFVPPAPTAPTLPAPPAAAPETRAAHDGEEVLEVVVTGSRVEEAAGESVASTEVVRRHEIERSGARDVAELLEERAGLQITRSFRGAELWLRGMDPEYTLVLVDGDRVPGRIGGAIDLSRYGVEAIERVEIVRGPSSALYGSEAIGGVVNIITREPVRDVEADALASYGLGNVLDATGRVAIRPLRPLRLQVTGGLHRADAFRRDGGAATTGSARSQWSLGGRVDLRPNARHRLRAQVDYVRPELRGVDEGAGGATFDRTQLQEQLQASLEHRVDASRRVQLRNRLSYSQFREQYLLDQRGSSQLDRYEDNREHLGQITSILHLRPREAHGITLGFEQIFQVLDSERLARSGRRSRDAVFAQYEWRAFDDGERSLTVVPGARFDLDSQFGEQLSPKLAVRFDAAEELVARASYGRGFRAPSFQELLLRFENPSVGYVVSGNPDLGAETSHGVDVGLDWQAAPWLEVSGTLFRNDLRNMIAVVTVDDGNAAGTLYSYENLESAWTMGLESSARVRAKDFVTVTAGYTLTETWDGENERRLEGRARHRVTIAPRLAYEPWEIELVARAAVLVDRVFYVDDDGDGLDDAVRADPLTQVDLRLAKRFTRHLELFAGIDNVFDAGDRFTVLRPFTVYGGARGRY